MDLNSTVKLITGNEMPVIGLGTWKLTERTAEAIKSALQLGYPMIDTSGDYGTQPGIAEGILQSGKARKDFYLETKVEEYENAYESTKNNLRQLKLDYADLMLIHRPPPDGSGLELWKGLMRARDEGLAKDIGVSNYSIDQIQDLADSSGEMPAVNQIEWSPFGFSQDMLDFCRKNNIIIQAYSPLTRTEKLDNPSLNEIAERRGKSPAQVLIRWNFQLGTVPLPKANKIEHQKENIDVFDFELDEVEMSELSSLNENFSSLGAKPLYI